MQMTESILQNIRGQIAHLKTIPNGFYAKRFRDIELGDVRSQADFEALPLRTRTICAQLIRWAWPPCRKSRLCASTLPAAPRARR